VIAACRTSQAVPAHALENRHVFRYLRSRCLPRRPPGALLVPGRSSPGLPWCLVDALTEYAERMWRGEVTMRGLLADGAPMGVAAPVADGVVVVPGFANVIAFRTEDGLVLVDTGLSQTA